MRLLLIRHGQTPSNVRGALDTARPGAGLTELGHAQARAIPAALVHEDVVGVYASPLVRTQLTAAPLADALGLEAQVVEGLEEISAGDLEMRTEDASRHEYAACVGAWMLGELGQRMPGGSDGHEFLARYDAALAQVAQAHPEEATVVVVSHGAAIRAWTALRCGIDVEEAIRLSIMNTGAAVVEGSPATGWTQIAWHSEPLGGVDLEDLEAAEDVTGESVAEAGRD